MSSRVWFFAVAGTKHGPYSFEELRACAVAGRFSKADYVWQPAFGNDWLFAGQVEGLFAAEGKSSEPVDVSSPVPPEIKQSNNQTIKQSLPPHAVASAVGSIARTFSIFFRQTSFRRWCGIGFCVWLSSMAMGALGSYFSSLSQGAQSLNEALVSLQSMNPEQMLRMVESMKPLLDARIDQFVAFMEAPLASVDFLKLAFGLVFALWGLWLSCRGDIMLIHRWREPDASVHQCWLEAIVPSNRLFRWRLMVLVLTVIVAGAWGRFIANEALRDYIAHDHQFPNVVAAFQMLFNATSLALLAEFMLLSMLDVATDFVVPVLEANPEKTMGQAWRVVLGVICRHPFRFLGYYIVKFLLSGFWLLLYGILIAFSHGAGAFLIAIPFVGSVLVAPPVLSLRGYAALWMNSARPKAVPDPEEMR